MTEENISQESMLKNVNEIINYFFEEINQNKLMSKKHKKIVEFWIKLFILELVILVSTVTGCVSISAVGSLVAIL